MKILLACLEKDSKAVISEVFARAAYFAVYDTDSMTYTYLENTAAEASSGAGVKAAQEAIDSKATLVVARRLGENSFDIFKESNIKVLIAKKDATLEELVKLALDKKLETMLEGKVGFHHA